MIPAEWLREAVDAEDLAVVLERVPPEFWRDFFRSLAYALRSSSSGAHVARVNLKGGHVPDWKFELEQHGRPSKERGA